jgi:hypothetical protein
MAKYIYDIHFGGTVDENPDEKESLEDIRALILESFRPDLQAGVTLNFNSIVVSELPSFPNSRGKE